GAMSEWLWTSTKPGASTAPSASIDRPAAGTSEPSRPTHAIRSPSTPTDPRKGAEPVPSTISASVTTRSSTPRVSAAGEPSPEGGTAARPPLHPRAAPVELREPFHERQPDADARRVFRRRARRLSERLEDRLAELVGDPGAVILHGEDDPAVLRL